MELSQTYSIKTLLVFENTINKELIRSLHVYRLEDGKEKEVEREFVFRRDGPYAEMAANPLLRLQKFRVSKLFRGRVTGLWLCIFAFHADRLPHLFPIPPVLLISRNPKLKSIPNLADDLQMIFRCGGGVEDERMSSVSLEETFEGKQNHSSRSLPAFDQDLNCPPNSVSALKLSEIQKGEQGTKGMIMMKKKKRATSKDVSRIAMEDLAKYFDVPLVEASKSLKIGVTVLKKRCRELGIPRWPHRKIKSLDGLIRDLQKEAAQWQHENEAAAFAVAKRRMMLETEKEIIERKPFIELQRETKQFRQDVFKRRHKARAVKNQGIEVLNTNAS